MGSIHRKKTKELKIHNKNLSSKQTPAATKKTSTVTTQTSATTARAPTASTQKPATTTAVARCQHAGACCH
ncbi:hypothetical protein DSO57_1036700 [Entomophthora muscae]|uniref:Uncharacterized protein n=1 Tax=Entomophthora muscae TaxID=34485 RepID=A0ACC2TLB0_9FUNG|nr:hypothetical protein DSO57_1036700 [Entomophthora muscae]